MTRIAPFLMFEGQAGEAARFYVDVFGGRIIELQTYGADDPGPEGTVKVGSFEAAGLTVMVADSPAKHDFTFTPSASLFVTCDDEAAIERYAAALGEGGKFLMPLGDYGFSRRFCWVSDRFGVSWQLNLP